MKNNFSQDYFEKQGLAAVTNSWAVRFREKNYVPKKDGDPWFYDEEHHGWKIEAWYPSVIIDTVNGEKTESAFDIGEVRAAHHAFRKSQQLPDFNWDIKKVFFQPHNEDRGWSYEGTQREVYHV